MATPKKRKPVTTKRSSVTRRRARPAGGGPGRGAGAAAAPPAPSEGPRERARRDPVTGRLVFPKISPRAYEHPADRAALAAMRAIPGFDALLRAIFRQVGDRPLRLAFLASSVRVGPRQFPEVHARYLDACRVLDIGSPPELFVAQTPIVNAGAIGVDRPFIVLNSGALGLLDSDELHFLLGHELGHVLSGHALYKTMLRILLRMYLVAASVPLGGPAILAITAALLEWDRKSELSADRAGLLVAQSPEVAMQVHMKLAGGGRTGDMSMAEFLAQSDEYEAGGSVLDSLFKFLQMTGTTHPFPVLRLAELKGWTDSGGYDTLATGDYPARAGDASVSVYEELKRSSQSYRDDFAKSRDPLARWLMDMGRKAQGAGASLLEKLRGTGASGPRRSGARKARPPRGPARKR
jgi:Zn-dependent protease with chaperone function